MSKTWAAKIPLWLGGLILAAVSAFLLSGPGTVPARAGSPSGKAFKLSLAASLCLDKAREMADQGKLADAIHTLETFIADSGKGTHPYLYFSLGNYLAMSAMDTGDVEAGKSAIPWYEKAVDADPGFSEAWLNLARCCYEAGDYNGAARGFEMGYEHAQTPQPVHLYYAAVCRFQSDQSEKALALFDTLMANHPQEITLAWKEVLVNILFSLDRYKKALPHVEELAAETAPPRQKKWQEILLQQYLNLDMDKKALAFATTLTRTDPLEPKWWKALAHLRLKIGKGEKAQARALADLLVYGYLTPMTPEEKQLAGDLCLNLEIPGKAAAIYKEILDGRFDFTLLEKQAQALVMAHLPGRALEVINQALAGHGIREKPGRDLIRLKQDLEQVLAYRKGLRAYDKLNFMTGSDPAGQPHLTKETQ